MGRPNMQRLADLGQLPKNYIASKLIEKNVEKLKSIIKRLTEENIELKKKLEIDDKKEEKINIFG